MKIGGAGTLKNRIFDWPNSLSQPPAEAFKEFLLKPEFFCIATSWYQENPFTNEICQASSQDTEVLEGLKKVKDLSLYQLPDSLVDFEEGDGIVYYQGKVYVPADKELCHKVIHSVHDTLSAGHPGYYSTIELLVWPSSCVPTSIAVTSVPGTKQISYCLLGLNPWKYQTVPGHSSARTW